jgi:hypothetical protein
MRHGTRTVLSMQNDYEGPPEDFAMVVPLPVAVERENVHTLPHEVFDRIEAVSEPRLVEYEREITACYGENGGWGSGHGYGAGGIGMLGVTVHATFEVGEYDIVVLGSSDSMALDRWLRTNGYRIPAGAELVLRPYVEEGSHFLVARVDVDRVTFQNGRERLSPLRIHYDTDRFALPVRLGLLNSGGEQDLLVHILAPERYEVANYDNVFVPTNLRVRPEARGNFRALYAAILSRTFERNPEAVVTEYAWTTTSCDPCTTETLTPTELLTLGGDVIETDASTFTLTRLHYRYGRDGLDEDLVFRAAPAVNGGTGIPDQNGRLDPRIEDAADGSFNTFQARYVILRAPGRDEPACDGHAVYGWTYPSGELPTDAATDAVARRRARTGSARRVRLERYLLDVPAELRSTAATTPRPRPSPHAAAQPVLPTTPPESPATPRRRQTAILASRPDSGRASTPRAS